MAGSWRAELDRLDAMLRHRPALRLRVACPSQEFSAAEMALGTGRWYSCVRGIWESLSLARDPDLALVMLQAPPVPEKVMDFLFEILPGSGQAADARQRHALVALADDRERHLSDKILQTPTVLARLRQTIEQARASGHTIEGLSCFASSPTVATLADALRLDLLATPPSALHWGTKAGSREIFRRASVPHPPGSYTAEHDIGAIAAKLSALAGEHGTGRWLVKITDGFGSGHGNAVVDLDSPEPRAVEDALRQRLRPACPDISAAEFLHRVRRNGAVVEQHLAVDPPAAMRFPSVSALLRCTKSGCAEIDLLGTHEQVIDATQQFVGCQFPADPAYRGELLRHAIPVLRQLRQVGAVGYIGIDFLVRPDTAHNWSVHALEVNLRQTGSTHSNGTVRALVEGRWEPDGRLLDATGAEVFYTSTDGLISPDYRGIPADTLVRALQGAPRLCYDTVRARGVVPHLWTTLEPYGKVGATFVGRSRAECDGLQVRFTALLHQLGGATTSR